VPIFGYRFVSVIICEVARTEPNLRSARGTRGGLRPRQPATPRRSAPRPCRADASIWCNHPAPGVRAQRSYMLGVKHAGVACAECHPPR
jgi:hypothetical protein